MTDDHFLGETLRPEPNVTPTVTDGDQLCCLCSEPIGLEAHRQQSFEADASGRTYCAHAKCSHEYAMAIRAFRSLAGI